MGLKWGKRYVLQDKRGNLSISMPSCTWQGEDLEPIAAKALGYQIVDTVAADNYDLANAWEETLQITKPLTE